MHPALASVRDLVADDLRAVEAHLSSAVQSCVELVPEVYRHALLSGGKKLRPVLVILSAHAAADGGPSVPREAVARFAAAAEMTHLASLIHDDVAEGSSLRRGRPTPNALWRNKLCVFVADFIFASVFAELSTPEHAPLLRELSRTVNRMCEGEILQALEEGNLDATEETYLSVIRLKTASLMGTAAAIGGRLGGCDDEIAGALRRYGEDLGVAFQITDDLLDLTGDERETGKHLGDDLRAGRMTLPLIYALADLSDGRAEALRADLSRAAGLTEDEVRRIAGIAEGCGAVERALKVAAAHAERAAEELAALPENPARRALIDLARTVTARRA